MVHKTQDYKSLLLLGSSFWTFFSIAGMVGALNAFSDISAFWFVPLFFISLPFVSYSARRIITEDQRVGMLSRGRDGLLVGLIGGMVLFAAALSLHLFDHIRVVESMHSCSETNPDACGRAANYFDKFSYAGGYTDVAYYRSQYRRFTEHQPTRHAQKLKFDAPSVGQLYATCLFGDRQTMIEKMRKRDAFTWFAYSKFGSPQDIFGGFVQGPRDKRACESLMDLGRLEHQEVGCTGLIELCDLENSDRCDVRRRQCKVVLSSPFE